MVIENFSKVDIFAHGLWTGLIFHRYKRKNIFWAIFFGTAPDLFSFGVFLIATFIFGGAIIDGSREHWSIANAQVSQYTDILYNLTHSFVVFATVFLIIWFWRKKPLWPILAWGIHIALDVPLHNAEFFPTPFLFPLSSFKITLISWAETSILLANYLLLAIGYLILFLIKNKRKHLTTYFWAKRKLLKR